MKKLIILITTVLLSHLLISQTTWIPDNNFEQKLINLGLDTGNPNGSVPTANIANVTSLDVSYSNISNLTGIEGFTSLTHLDCSNNNLPNLSLGLNTALIQLDCSSNNISAINLTQLTVLTDLDCHDNQLHNLYLIHNSALNVLKCGQNQISNLNISSNTALTYLNCIANQLTSLDVSNNTALTHLYCNYNQLTSLDLSNNTALSTLSCSNNQLTSLDVNSNTALTHLYCGDNQLTSLDLSNNTILTYLNCSDNQLTSLDLSNNTALSSLNYKNNQLVCLNLKNGNNTNLYIYNVNLNGNPGLSCIEVDNAAWALANWPTPPSGNPNASFSNDCNNSCSSPTICQASFSYTQHGTINGNITVDFINASTTDSSTATQWLWDFGDGNTSTNNDPSHTYAQAGTYIVCLSIIDPGCQTMNYCDTITLNDICQTSFTYTQNGSTIDFNNTSTLDSSLANNIYWSFGDGGISFDFSPTHTYNSPGTYTICLYLYSTQYCTASTSSQFCTTITINPPPCQASFITQPGGNYPCGAYFINTSIGASSYSWDFGDGTISSSQTNVGHSYSSPGNYLVTLYTYDSLGYVCDTASRWVTNSCGYSSNCQAGFTAQIYGPGYTNDTICGVNFTNTSSGATSYIWYFGDGNTSTQSSPSHTYAANGTYKVILSTYDSLGISCDSTSQWITINCGGNQGCQASFSTYADSSCGIYINNTSTGAAAYKWFFGDGSTSTQTSPYHTYASSGSYLITLITYDTNRNVCDSASQYVTISCGGCFAYFHALGDSSCGIYFHNYSSGAAGYKWFFGDGSTSTQTSPHHSYAGPGSYKVTLFSYDINRNVCDSLSKWVTIDSMYCGGCYADFYAYTDSSCGMHFYNSSYGAAAYKWFFGDGSSSTQSAPHHTYAGTGSYQVTLLTFDSNRILCDSISRWVYIDTMNCGGCQCSFRLSSNPSSCDVDIINDSKSAASYKWELGDGNISTDKHPSHSYADNGTYEVVLNTYDANDNLCCLLSQWVNVDCITTGIEHIDILEQVNIYPNPMQESLSIELKELESGSLTLTLTNIMGQEVYRQIMNQSKLTIQRQDWPSGVYLLTMTNGLEKIQKKIVLK